MSQSYVPTAYVPTSHTVQDDGDAAFWGNLLEPGPEKKPSALFPRLTDSIFFYLDEHVAPQRTGYLEPAKVAYWINACIKPALPVCLVLCHRSNLSCVNSSALMT
jgi:hypothetical protein